MQSLRDAIAIVLCGSLFFPAPLGLAQETAATDQTHAQSKHRPEYVGPLKGDERILQALNRFTFGPRPGDLEAVRKLGPGETGLDKWFEQQLHPANIDEKDLDARLADYPAMQWSTQDLLFRMPSPAIIRQAIDGKVQIPSNGTLHAVYENQIYRLQLRKAAQAEKQNAAAQNAAAASMASAPGPANSGMSADAGMNAGANQNGAQAGPTSPGPASAGMDANASAAPNAYANAQAAPAMQGDMNSAANAPGLQNTMTPASPASDQPLIDPGMIAGVLALAPDQRIRRLQAMQPEEFEAFMKSLKPAQRVAIRADLNPDLRESLDDLEAPEQTAVQELFAERLARDIYSNAQLQEVMTDFWLNHFNIFLRKNEQMPYYLVSYERDTIRPLALGKFEDLLEAVAHSPAMLIYLDNAQSIGPDSMAAERAKMNAARRPGANKKVDEGLNENYARELMELHTLGVNGGYTQADVIQVARVLTGWTVDRPQFGGGYTFAEPRHEPGTKTVMGEKIKENGEMEGRELLHFLATRPATAQFISRKLAIRFVSDDPPQALVDRMAKAYLASGGDIPAVLTALFHSPEFWAASDYRAKVKTPLEFVVSAARASNANIENYQPLVNALRQMGMPLYGCVPPVGYKWDAADWVSTGALVDRMNFALSLAANRFPGITVEWAPEVDMSTLMNDTPSQQVVPTPESEESRLEPMLVAGGVSDATRTAALQQFAAQSAQNPWPVPAATNPTPVRAAGPAASAAAPDAQRFAQLARAKAGAAAAANRPPAPDAYEREDQVLAGLLMGSPEFQRR
jgi:uncharacterized protein (DUF1800 family)